MANLSHLSQTVVSNYLITDSFPKDIQIATSIERENKTIWSFTGNAGKNSMKDDYQMLLDQLFSKKWLLEKGMVFYTLTGAVVSSAKQNVILKSGDIITSELPSLNISLHNVFQSM